MYFFSNITLFLDSLWKPMKTLYDDIITALSNAILINLLKISQRTII